MLRHLPAWLLASALFAGCTQPESPHSTPPTVAKDAATMPTANPAPTPATRRIATFGGGCFWCIEAVLERVDGVLDVVSGYAGGTVDNPTYRQVCDGTTGHAEVVQVTFDPARVGYDKLLEWFFKLHDPTTLNRQGPDEGTQYRSVIFCHDDEQMAAAKRAIATAQPKFSAPIVTEVTAAPRFWPAEDYHQDYFAKNPNDRYCRAMIPSKLQKLGLELPKK
jgi:peptide-methionine (S)-S-oxide reductase